MSREIWVNSKLWDTEVKGFIPGACLTPQSAVYRMVPVPTTATDKPRRSSYMSSLYPFPDSIARSRRKGVAWWNALMFLALLLVPLLVSCGSKSQQATDFQVTLFNGGSFRLSDQVGKTAVVLNFWYPTCPPCRAEMPAFQRSWQALQGEEIRFLGLFVPQGLDTEQDARDFVDELGLTYDFATDTRAQVAQSYEVLYFPTTVFVDRNGRIFRSEIAALDEQKIIRIVRQMTQG